MALQLDRTIKAGDILTSITIVVSVLALLLSLAKDRDARVSEQANKVRAAAATVLVKLDRWQALQLSLYQTLQPDFVELSEDLAKVFDVVAVRDKFWKRVNAARNKIAEKVLDEQLTTGYGDILTHFPAARREVADALRELANIEAKTVEEFFAQAEPHILSLRDKQPSYQTAHLGNALRGAAATATDRLTIASDRALASVRTYLFGVIARSDAEIVQASRAVPASQPQPR